MGKINKNQMVYDVEGNTLCIGKFIVEEGQTPASYKYPGGVTMMSHAAAKGKHVCSHKPVKNHRGKVIPRR